MHGINMESEHEKRRCQQIKDDGHQGQIRAAPFKARQRKHDDAKQKKCETGADSRKKADVTVKNRQQQNRQRGTYERASGGGDRSEYQRGSEKAGGIP